MVDTRNTYSKYDMLDIHYDAWKKGYNASRWVSVEERLPTTNDSMYSDAVIVNSNGGVFIALYSDAGEWRRGSDGTTIFPTHWQPLPEPPTTEKTEG
tara:strand:- start:132 stop:422 length:291 start_codon:yes stop_codon:yes gene_type:complete